MFQDFYKSYRLYIFISILYIISVSTAVADKGHIVE